MSDDVLLRSRDRAYFAYSVVIGAFWFIATVVKNI